MQRLAPALQIEHDASLRAYNTFGLPAVARTLVHIRSALDVRRVVDHPEFGRAPKLVLGGGSNMVFTRDVAPVVLKMDVRGRRLVETRDDAFIVEAGAGEPWHEFVEWTLANGFPGLENLALIPGTVGASPVQNIGAYGIELKDRFESLSTVDLVTGRSVTLDARTCAFGYRDSVFKQEGFGGLAGKSVITHVRFRLPRPWQPVLGYLELERRMQESGNFQPDAQTVFEWVCDIRRSKLPDWREVGNAGSFFKNPVVTMEQCRDIIGRDPEIVHYPMPDGTVKLAAGWLIDACGWKGKTVGRAGVYEKQALVLVNRGGASGAEVVTLARAIQESVYGRFGIRLEPEPLIV
ncbi:UDP-N-acetylmuramate dehydrogenase [Aquincola tertiaricarbonis]|uniref:UDP-N-acetylenolpyruvoylglucosamine reductase n=1 Tax=Aquincola tertiaricarbonis TaxID=391953 RepID=A0ABY4SHT7_AQUTE|nr:UDP-N-acetylmuramate dehydrogenase [Aquincola tertiaricarbonis]URI10880.1 UDP-N-acetylmuramate dehydrogenase [Aquincola tertiaricarbonis]